VGKRFRVDTDKGPYVQVVGVARDSKYLFASEPAQNYFYLPFAQGPNTRMVLLTQSGGDPASLAAPIRELVHSMDPDQPVFNVRTFANFFDMRMSPLKMVMQMVVAMGLMGLTLALIGIYGLISYSVARRTREIGVRIAIGANRADVIKMVLRQGLVLAVTGIAVGGALSLLGSKALTAGFVGLAQPSLAAFIAVPIAVLLIAVAACWAPAWRASRVDPIRALRFE
jgi:putative ABC transport system permease protein